MPDVVIVGSGAAGVAAAWGLVERGLRPLLLDVGVEAPKSAPPAEGNLYDHRRREDTFDLMIGEHYQGLANLLTSRQVPAKLTAPNMTYVTQGAGELSPIDEAGFCAIQSFARGGLGNAWGAGLYRYTDDDLAAFPIRSSDLDPYFDTLTRHIGIRGADDDLTRFFGSPEYLGEPLPFSHNIARLHARYERRRDRLHRAGVYVGRPRMAVRPSADGHGANLEFWQHLPTIYRPTQTLDDLIAADQIDYRPGVLVRSWSEAAGRVRIDGTEVASKQPIRVETKALVLAAGAINTSRIVLGSLSAHRQTLPLLENPAVQIPLVLPGSIGRPLDFGAFGLTQLNVVWERGNAADRLQGSFLEITSPMRGEFFGSFPFSARANLALLRFLMPAILVLQVYWPASGRNRAALSLRADGHLRIEGGGDPIEVGDLAPLLAQLRRIGAWTHPRLVVRVPTGHAVHYAGTLPMSKDPKPYQCHPSGRLEGTRSVFVADSAGFPTLSAKNMSFAMMANAMRVAGCVAEQLLEAT